MAQQYATSVGDGASTSFAVSHNLATLDVAVEVYDMNTPFARVVCEVERPSTTQITVKFDVAPASNRYRVVVLG